MNENPLDDLLKGMKQVSETSTNEVFCDFCSEDFTNRDDKGGLLFGSYATCPICAPRIERDAKRDGEERFIKARCPADMAFRDWVIVELRSLQPGSIKVFQ